MVKDEGIDMELANADRGLWEMVWLERIKSKIGWRRRRRGGCEVDDLEISNLILCEVNQTRPSSHAAKDNNKSNKSNQKMIVHWPR